MNKGLLERIRLGQVHMMAEEPAGGGAPLAPEPPPEGETTDTPPPDPAAEEKAAEEAAAKEEAERKERNRKFAEERLKQKEERERRIAAEAEAKYQLKIEEMERKLQALEAGKKEREPEVLPPKPRPEDFESFDAFLDARDEWVEKSLETKLRRERESEVAREREEREKAAVQTAQERSFVALKDDYGKRENEYRAGLGADGAAAYDAASDSLTPFLVDERGTFTNPILATALLRAGPQVTHYYADHLEELAALVGSHDPLHIAMEVGAAKRAVTDNGRHGRRYTKAPEPPPRVSGGPAPGLERDYRELSAKEFEERRMRELGLRK